MIPLDLSRALPIPGWLYPWEMEWLAGAASVARSIVEIGSWRGRSTRAIADNSRCPFYCVDLWQDSFRGIPGWWSTPADDDMMTRPGWLAREFERNLSDHVGHRLYPVSLPSVEAAALLARYTDFDLCFIDADHAGSSVKADIEAWLPLMRDGGMLCGHDYGGEWTPEVKPAVDEMLPGVSVYGTIWYWRVRQDVAHRH